MPSSREPETIGRFRLLKVLGKGAQGKVYLAEDPKLQRQVAIKTLPLESGADRDKEIQTLLDEARIVSRLQHPNIVTLFDAGEENGTPYLVFEFVEGTTLAQLVRDKGRLPATRAVEIALQILEGIGYAHQMDVIHRDLKPGNIMIDRKGTARVMDFGIASKVSTPQEGDDALFGTPLYMAPEYISERISSPAADVFATGMLLYEMLAGRTAVLGGNVYEILHRMVHVPFDPPSKLGGEVDERLDEIVMRALEKNPAARYHNAEEMATALKDYLAPQQQRIALSGDAKQVALDFLLLKMRHKSDFPALARTVSVVNKIIRADQQSAANLANTILKDFALTNKLLKMVNTAHYQQFGGKISTVSRAVTIMGFDTIRNIALSLMLFDKLQNQSQAAHLKDEVLASFFAGILARRLVPVVGVHEMEEAFICAMLHSLGRLLVMFYFLDEYPEIEQRVQDGEDEEKAAAAVLGLSFEEIGVGIAKAWNFPDKIVYSLRRLTVGATPPHGEGDEKLRQLAGLANELCRVMRNTPPEEREAQLALLEKTFGRHFTFSPDQLSEVTELAVTDLIREAAVLNFDVLQSPLFLRISAWSEAGGKTLREFVTAAQETSVPGTLVGEETLEVVQEAPDSLAILSAGIQDITNTLVSEYKINDVMHIILETMYRAMGFSRILLCAVDPQRQNMCGRFGLGKGVDRLATEFHFPLAYSPDVFHKVFQTDYLAAPDIDTPELAGQIPDWYRRLVPAQGLLLLPIVVDKKPLGLIYADKDRGAPFELSAKELGLLKTLRNQAVLAIERKR